MRPQYSVGYTLDDDLQVVTECRAYVRPEKRGSRWDELKPNHSSNDYIKPNPQSWYHKDYYHQDKQGQIRLSY